MKARKATERNREAFDREAAAISDVLHVLDSLCDWRASARVLLYVMERRWQSGWKAAIAVWIQQQ